MAKRYSGNVELRISLRRMRGDNGRMGWFYVAHVSTPRHHGEGILSPREVGIQGRDLRSPESFDMAASAFLSFADEETQGLVGSDAVRKGRRWEVLRVQQSPCPVEDEGRKW